MRRDHPSAPYANSQDADHAEQASHNRAELAHAMGGPKDVHALNQARAEDSRIRNEVGIRSDGRAYGSGSTNDPRGHRLLHDHFAAAFDKERAYSGPEDYDPREYGYDNDYGYAHGYQGSNHARYPKVVPPHPKAPARDENPETGLVAARSRVGQTDDGHAHRRGPARREVEPMPAPAEPERLDDEAEENKHGGDGYVEPRRARRRQHHDESPMATRFRMLSLSVMKLTYISIIRITRIRIRCQATRTT
jgi:hypothetical protein